MKLKKIFVLLAAMMVLLLACNTSTDSGDENVEPVDAKYKRIQVPVITNIHLIVKNGG